MNSYQSLFKDSWSLVEEARGTLNQLTHPSITPLTRQQHITRVSNCLQDLTRNLERIDHISHNTSNTLHNDRTQIELLRNETFSIQREFSHYKPENNDICPTAGSTVIQIDDELREHERLTRVHDSIHEMIDIVGVSRNRIKAQDDLLRNVQNQFVSIFSRLGLSSTVLRLISQRIRGDKIIFIAGVCLVLLIIFIFVFIL
ncbi:Golgi SNAP receptor complex member 2 [Oopsacas minuta]|uniref:Golgi SNAP receptor complex member 2 n=1 Tax=Oopsacas minuta TaxID=111878 RepID=A0AAV7K438_9METZ|nr:Golgi SNAP receptor complex member 2 [Oopsacas minuta]